MPDITGLEVIESIQYIPEIIITTAYREFAVEGFELNVLDYLVKPIAFKRFVKAMDKFFEKVASNSSTQVQNEIGFLYVKAERKTIKIALEDILYLEGAKDYSKIILAHQKIITKVSIGNFHNDLPGDRFVQVHKSFIIAKNKITAYTGHDVEINGTEIPIGRVYKEAFIKEVKQKS